MSVKVSETSNGIGFLSVLTLIFIVLKLTGVINWSWWWVLGPLWIPFTAFIVIVVVGIVFYKIVKRLTAKN